MPPNEDPSVKFPAAGVHESIQMHNWEERSAIGQNISNAYSTTLT